MLAYWVSEEELFLLHFFVTMFSLLFFSDGLQSDWGPCLKRKSFVKDLDVGNAHLRRFYLLTFYIYIDVTGGFLILNQERFFYMIHLLDLVINYRI